MNDNYYYYSYATAAAASGGKKQHHSTTTPNAFHFGAKEGVHPGQIAVVTIKSPKPKKKQSTPPPDIKKTVKEHNKALAEKSKPKPVVHHIVTHKPIVHQKHDAQKQIKHDVSSLKQHIAKQPKPVIHKPAPVVHHVSKPQPSIHHVIHTPQQSPSPIHHIVAPTNQHPSIVHHVSKPLPSIHHVIHTQTPTVHTSTPNVLHPSMTTPSTPASHTALHNITTPHTAPVTIQRHHHIHQSQAQRDLNVANQLQNAPQNPNNSPGKLAQRLRQQSILNHHHISNVETLAKQPLLSFPSGLRLVDKTGQPPITLQQAQQAMNDYHAPDKIQSSTQHPQHPLTFTSKGTPNPFTNPNPNLSVPDIGKGFTDAVNTLVHGPSSPTTTTPSSRFGPGNPIVGPSVFTEGKNIATTLPHHHRFTHLPNSTPNEPLGPDTSVVKPDFSKLPVFKFNFGLKNDTNNIINPLIHPNMTSTSGPVPFTPTNFITDGNTTSAKNPVTSVITPNTHRHQRLISLNKATTDDKIAQFNAQPKAVRINEINKRIAEHNKFNETGQLAADAQFHAADDKRGLKRNSSLVDTPDAQGMSMHMTPQAIATMLADNSEGMSQSSNSLKQSPTGAGNFTSLDPKSLLGGTQSGTNPIAHDDSQHITAEGRRQLEALGFDTDSLISHYASSSSSSSDSYYLPILIGGGTALLLFALSSIK